MKIAKTIFSPDDGTGSNAGTTSTGQPPTPCETSPTKPTSPPETEKSRRILRLTRSAERVDRVERELIKKISHSFEVDTATQQLLTELRMSTNRLRGQISEMERFETVDES